MTEDGRTRMVFVEGRVTDAAVRDSNPRRCQESAGGLTAGSAPAAGDGSPAAAGDASGVAPALCQHVSIGTVCSRFRASARGALNVC